MAINIHLERTETELFCSSKWWGDPDLPADMSYPTIPVREDGESFDLPLTFVCQIDCEDLAPLDPKGLLPHEGMFYVFAALDEYADYESPAHNGPGEWPRKQVVVKYTKAVNFETFRAAIFVDENDNPVTEPALRMTFSEGPDDGADTRLLGLPAPGTTPEGLVDFLQIASGTAGLAFPGDAPFHLLIDPAEMAKGHWHRISGFLCGNR